MPIELTKREILQAVKTALLIEKTTADLKKDVERYLGWTAKESDDVFWRRGLVRAVFAYIEGLTYQLKRESYLARTLPRRDKFSAAELLLLVDRDYRLNDNGEIKWGKAKISLATNLQFAFRMYAKAMSLDYSLPKHQDGWEKFKTAISIRDRLTHPKVASDLEVSKDDVTTVLKGFKWIQDCQKELLAREREDAERRERRRLAANRTKRKALSKSGKPAAKRTKRKAR